MRALSNKISPTPGPRCNCSWNESVLPLQFYFLRIHRSGWITLMARSKSFTSLHFHSVYLCLSLVRLGLRKINAKYFLLRPAAEKPKRFRWKEYECNMCTLMHATLNTCTARISFISQALVSGFAEKSCRCTLYLEWIRFPVRGETDKNGMHHIVSLRAQQPIHTHTYPSPFSTRPERYLVHWIIAIFGITAHLIWKWKKNSLRKIDSLLSLARRN